jgi:hypothetical protein
MIKLITKESFTKEILNLVLEKNISFIEAVVLYAEKNNLEMETVSKFIDKSLKERIEFEARELKLLKSVDQLPV